MDHQKMWEGHRVILPEIREKVVNHCKDCRFFVSIQGAMKSEPVALQILRAFGSSGVV